MKLGTTTLVATVKNEGPYLWEWVAHHKSIGFDNIIIFQNDSNDLTHGILNEMRTAGLINYFYNNAEPNMHQIQAYTRATKTAAYQQSDWILALDLDEFLTIKTSEGTLQSWFNKLPSADYIVINWRLFGSSYKNIPNFDLTTTRFYRADPDGILSKNRPWGYKTMFRPQKFVRAGVHKPMPINPNDDFKIINASGLRSDKFVIDDWRSTDPKNRNLAQINHYIVRDAQSFVLKSARGRAHQIENQVHFSYWRKFNMNNDADTTLFHRENLLRQEMREIDALTDGKVSALTTASVEKHLEMFEDLMQVPEYADLYYKCIEQNAPP